MIKKEMIAMLLAGGQGSRLGVLTQKVAKPAVSFGGKYRIIDFPLSNCINSGVDTVGVLTQYQPLRLNTHIGIGIPWDLDRNVGGVTVLPPYERSKGSDWYTGTADGGDTQNEMYSIGRRAPGWNNDGLNGTKLSSLSVSYAAVPEPSAAALSLLAFMGFAARRRRK